MEISLALLAHIVYEKPMITFSNCKPQNIFACLFACVSTTAGVASPDCMVLIDYQYALLG